MWDHDWPGVFLFFGAIAERILLGLLIKFVGLPYIPKDLLLGWFVICNTLQSGFGHCLFVIVDGHATVVPLPALSRRAMPLAAFRATAAVDKIVNEPCIEADP